MPNIVNPAVAVAAQGGGKFLHCINLFEHRGNGDIYFGTVQYISSQSAPFTPQTFYSDMLEKGFTKGAEGGISVYPANGPIKYDSMSSSDFDYSSRPLGLYVEDNAFHLIGLAYRSGSGNTLTEDLSLDNARITDAIL